MVSPDDTDLAPIAGPLLQWFAKNGRDLPWRIGVAGARDPYQVWLCEIMMQQTTLPHGTPYYLEFLRRWPSVEALAAAKDEDVMSAWAGLGYYARARNLLKCAREVTALGGFPETPARLRKLPGIGPYTAGAIAAIAFGEPCAAVDGNVERVFSRLLAAKDDWKSAKKRIHASVRQAVPNENPGEFAEGLMDLGAMVCTPKAPNCPVCPLQAFCAAHSEGRPERYPVKPKRAKLPHRSGHVFVLKDGGEIMLERRPEKGLLGGMLGLPTSEWKKDGTLPPPEFPAKADWQEIGEVRHVFTHFSLELTVWQGRLVDHRPEGVWRPAADMSGLPAVFAKACNLIRGRQMSGEKP